MKERPILFSTEMVQAILDGRKTMIRRVIKPQPTPYDKTEWPTLPPGLDWKSCCYWGGSFERQCPYGQVGDRLWVRETFMFWKGADIRESYIGTNMEVALGEPPHYRYKADDPQNYGFKWRPSIFMPRHASRITLEITNIKVEKLQKITPEDAVAEGVEYMPPARLRNERLPVALIVFAGLWDKLNTKCGYPWESNPWVWVIEVHPVEKRNT